MATKKENKEGAGVGLKDREKFKLQKPPKYKVVMLNDNYTPMDFVSAILMQVFHKSQGAAAAITFQVHTEGKGIAGAGYTKEIADTKVAKTLNAAKEHKYPFLVEAEPE